MQMSDYTLTVGEVRARVHQIRSIAAEGDLTKADELRHTLWWNFVRYFVETHPDDPYAKLLEQVL